MNPDLEWHAHVTDEFSPNTEMVHIWRRMGDGIELIVGVTDTGDTIIRRVEQGEATPPGIRFPFGVMQSIAQELRPGPGSAEVKRLEEALSVERARVDAVLASVNRSNP